MATVNVVTPIEMDMSPDDVTKLRAAYPTLLKAFERQYNLLQQIVIRIGGAGSGSSTTDLTALTAQVESLEDDVFSTAHAAGLAQHALDVAERADSIGDQVALIPSIIGMIGDLQQSTSGGSAYGTDVEHDFGSNPVYDATFTITDANISASSTVLVTPGGAATGRTADDWQWDGATVGVVPGSGSATCYVTFHPGPIVGRRSFNYTVI